MMRDFHPSAETVGQWIALFILGALSFLLVFYEPPPTSKELLLILIGALAGALTVGGSKKFATATGPNPILQPEGDKP